MKEFLALSIFSGLPRDESRPPVVDRYALTSGSVPHSGLLRGLWLYPSRQQRSRSLTFCFYWPCHLSPSPGGSVCFGSLTVIPFTWAFMRWPYMHDGALPALPEVGLLGQGCCRIVRVPQNLCLTPLPLFRA